MEIISKTTTNNNTTTTTTTTTTSKEEQLAEEVPSLSVENVLISYCNLYSLGDFDSKHFKKYMNERHVTARLTLMVTQLKKVIEQNNKYRSSPLLKSLQNKPHHNKNLLRHHPYKRVLVDEPSSQQDEPAVPAPLKRAHSFEIKHDGRVIQLADLPPNVPVSLHFNFFETNALAKPTLPPSSSKIKVEAVLPDDSKAVVYMNPTSTVADLRFELRSVFLSKHLELLPESLFLDTFVLKTRGNWTLNLSETVADVIHQGSIIYCILHERAF